MGEGGFFGEGGGFKREYGIPIFIGKSPCHSERTVEFDLLCDLVTILNPIQTGIFMPLFQTGGEKYGLKFCQKLYKINSS